MERTLKRNVSLFVLLIFLTNIVLVVPAYSTVKTTLISAGIGAVGGALFGPLAGAVIGLSGGLIGGVPGAVAGSVSGLVAGAGLGLFSSISMPAVIGAAALGAGAFLAYNFLKKNYTALKPINNNQSYVNRTVAIRNGNYRAYPRSQYGISRSTHNFIPSIKDQRTVKDQIKDRIDRSIFGNRGRVHSRDGNQRRTILGGRVQLPALNFPLLNKIKALLSKKSSRATTIASRYKSTIPSRRSRATLLDAKDKSHLSIEDAGPERRPEAIGPERKPGAGEPNRKPEAIEPERKPGAAVKSGSNIKLFDSEKFRARRKYQVAYEKYIELLQSGKSINDPEVQAALAEYKRAYAEYIKMKKQK
jgi:hypothetical protein